MIRHYARSFMQLQLPVCVRACNLVLLAQYAISSATKVNVLNTNCRIKRDSCRFDGAKFAVSGYGPKTRVVALVKQNAMQTVTLKRPDGSKECHCP